MGYRTIQWSTRAELEPLRDDETWVRVWSSEIKDEAWQAVAAWFVGRPNLLLSIERGVDLEMLRFFPGLRRLSATSPALRSLDGLRHVAGTLAELRIGDTIPRASLRPLAPLRELQALGVIGTWSDIDTIGQLTGLRELVIGSIDLEILRPLERLERLHSGLGTVRSLELLPEVGHLELLGFFRMRGPHDLASLARMPYLRWLVLQSTSSITALPSFRKSPTLRWVDLDRMKGVRDLRPIAEAPSLEVLLLRELIQLEPEDLRPFIGHPSLRIIRYGFRSKRKDAAPQAILPRTGGRDWVASEHPDWYGTPHWNAAHD